MSEKLKGVVGSPLTPFSEDGSVDYDTLGKQVDFLIANGINAFTYPMHISESLNLTEVERKECAARLVAAVAGRVPTFINVSASGTKTACELAEHAASVGSDGTVVLGPYYWPTTPDDLLEHFVAVASAHGGKLLVYNSPSVTNGSLSVDLCTKLIERYPGFVGLKDASFNMDTFTGYCQMAKPIADRFSVFTGIEHVLSSMPLGGAGCLSAVSEITPRLARNLYEACASGNYEQARELQYTMYNLLGIILRSYPATIKYAAELMGRPTGSVRQPLHPLSDAEKSAAKAALEKLGVLDSEPYGWS